MGAGWKLALSLLVTLRLALGLVALMSIHLEPPTTTNGEWVNLVLQGRDVWSEALSTWQRWDALWYQRIAEHGYHAGDNTVHFQPLFPLLAHLISLPLAGQIVLAELLLSSVAFLLAMWLLYRVARLEVGPVTARLAVALTAFFPVGFFLLAPYSEGLYLALTLAAFWFARQGRPWLAGLAGFGAGLTRTVGLFLVLPLAFEYLRRREERGERPGPDLLAATLPVVGLLVTIGYERLIVGERRSMFEVGAHWGDRLVFPLEPLRDSWTHVAATADPVEMVNFLSLLAFAGLALLALRRLPLVYGLYVWPYLGLLACRESVISPLESVARYLLVLFPCFVVLASLLARRPWLAGGVIVVGISLQVVLFEYWVRFGFVA